MLLEVIRTLERAPGCPDQKKQRVDVSDAGALL